MEHLKELACVINTFRVNYLSFSVKEIKAYLVKQSVENADQITAYLIHKGLIQVTYGLGRFIDHKKPIHFAQLVDLELFIKKPKNTKQAQTLKSYELTEELAIEFLKSKGYLIFKKI